MTLNAEDNVKLVDLVVLMNKVEALTLKLYKKTACDGCQWKTFGRSAKCVDCRRNKDLPDRYE